jgi:hypothetical protein
MRRTKVASDGSLRRQSRGLLRIRSAGYAPRMALLLVDDRDGRIVSEIETEENAQRVLEAWLSDDGTLPEHLCLIEVHSHHGVVLGTDTSVKIRPLSRD